MYKFSIGEKLWRVTFSRSGVQVTCPECLGKRYLTVIMGDESRVTIDCVGCQSGYDHPKGTITEWKWQAKVSHDEVAGVSFDTHKTEYRVKYLVEADNGDIFFTTSTVSEEEVFETESQAKERGDKLAKEHAEKENERFNKCKEHRTRTWSWNATYHRKCIRDAQKNIQYHSSKLEVAKRYAKKTEATPSTKERTEK